MLNAWYFLSRGRGSDPESRERCGDMVYTHVIDCGDAAAWQEVLCHQFQQAGNYRFAIALADFGSRLDDFTGPLVLLMSHPYYERGMQGKPLFMTGAGAQAGAGEIGRQLCRQGIGVDMHVVEDGFQAGAAWRLRAGVEAVPLPRTPGEGLAELYYRYCLEAFDARDQFLLVEDPTHPGLAGAVAKGMAMFRADHPVLYERTDLNVRLMQERARLSERVAQLQAGNGILKELLELAGQSNEVNYILQFYKHEYEILPLWYKRFGHILKVMTGKRSFRSLFNRTAKKYRS